MYANQISTDFLKNQCAMLEQKLGRKLEKKHFKVTSRGPEIFVKIDVSVASRLKGMDLPERIGPHPVRFLALSDATNKVPKPYKRKRR